MNRRTILSAAFAVLLPLTLAAQSNTNSPYSYFGLGEFDLAGYGKTSGMGGVAYGIRTPSFVNHLNPASYAGFDSLRVVLDVAASGKVSWLRASNDGRSAFNGNIKRIALGLRLYKAWAVSLGMTPFTNVGYQVNAKEPVVGRSDEYSVATYSGDGGLSRLYFGTSIRPFGGFSVGANVSMLFGYINKTKITSHGQLDGTWTEKYRYKPRTALLFDFGAQYAIGLPGSSRLTLGLVGGLSSGLRMAKYYSVFMGAEGDEEMRDMERFYLPLRLGGGLAFNSKRWTFAADYETQRWADVAKLNRTTRYVNSHRAALGASFCPNYYLGRNLFQRMTYQAGLHYERTHLSFQGLRSDAYGVTVGVDMPFRQQLSSLSLSVDAGIKGRAYKDMIRETYIRLNMGISFSDFWFLKRQYD